MAGTKLCDPSLISASLVALEMSIAHIIKRFTNVLFTVSYTVSETLTSL